MDSLLTRRSTFTKGFVVSDVTSADVSLELLELGTASVETKGPNTVFKFPDFDKKTGNNPFPPP
jgi:hypothetical protein